MQTLARRILFNWIKINRQTRPSLDNSSVASLFSTVMHTSVCVVCSVFMHKRITERRFTSNRARNPVYNHTQKKGPRLLFQSRTVTRWSAILFIEFFSVKMCVHHGGLLWWWIFKSQSNRTVWIRKTPNRIQSRAGVGVSLLKMGKILERERALIHYWIWIFWKIFFSVLEGARWTEGRYLIDPERGIGGAGWRMCASTGQDHPRWPSLTLWLFLFECGDGVGW